MNTVTLHYVEFMTSSIGVWDKQWFLTEEEARDHFTKLVEKGYHDANEDWDDEDHPVVGPYCEEVELTRDGILRFANTYAVDTGAA